MTALNKQALREAAEKATKGEWRAFAGAGGTCSIHTAGDERFGDVVDWPGFDGKRNAKANAKFIAAANPSTVLALLDELESAEKRIAELDARAFNPAILDVVAERQRQQSAEGWAPEHDDQYGKSQLLWASSCYMLNTIQPFNRIPMDWPWDSSWWKPTNPRRDLVKSGALIIAEIERIDRADGIGVKGEHQGGACE
ncbi:ead/Ea22-like family protein [Salmonella enterica]|nr:ead/Ea22-like family protein [Salmonella enterica]